MLEAWEGGCVHVARWIARAYRDGTGVERDVETAVEWFGNMEYGTASESVEAGFLVLDVAGEVAAVRVVGEVVGRGNGDTVAEDFVNALMMQEEEGDGAVQGSVKPAGVIEFVDLRDDIIDLSAAGVRVQEARKLVSSLPQCESTGDYSVTYKVGKALVEGWDGFRYNPVLGVTYIHKAAEKGLPVAMFDHGRHLAACFAMVIDIKGGWDWIERAANAGHVPAYPLLASYHRKGGPIDSSEDWSLLPAGITFATRGAELGDAECQYILGHHLAQTSTLSAAVPWYAKSCAQGYPPARQLYGVLLLRGNAVPEDRVTAEEHISYAAACGLALSRSIMSDIATDVDDTRKHCERAEKGDAISMSLIGWYLLAGIRGMERDEKMGVEFIKKAAGKGFRVAQRQYAAILEDGVEDEEGRSVLKRDYKKAVEYYQKAAKQGEPQSQTALCSRAMDTNSATLAWSLALSSARQGHAQGLTFLLVLCVHFSLPPTHFTTAVSLVTQFAEWGHTEAQRLLGVLYLG
ncbi:hypothetical protein HK104_006885, partial [Borealophlyctis nickersoniae]